MRCLMVRAFFIFLAGRGWICVSWLLSNMIIADDCLAQSMSVEAWSHWCHIMKTEVIQYVSVVCMPACASSSLSLELYAMMILQQLWNSIVGSNSNCNVANVLVGIDFSQNGTLSNDISWSLFLCHFLCLFVCSQVMACVKAHVDAAWWVERVI
jgi:hypothetical protein